MKIRIEAKRINRLSNIVETAPIQRPDFWALYVQRMDEEFGETYWDWVSDHKSLEFAYARSVSLGDSTPELRAA